MNIVRQVLTVACLLATGATPAGVSGDFLAPAQGAAPPWTCVAHVQPLQAAGSAMHANGMQTCSGSPTWKLQRVVVDIQQHVFLGFWKTVASTDSGPASEDSVERTVFYDCKNQGGSATFRARIVGYAANSQYKSKETLSTNEIDMNCDKGVGASHQVG